MTPSKPLRLERLTCITRVNGVDVYLHWTVFVVIALFLANSIRHPLVTLTGLVAYLSVLLIHECGHLFVAQRLHCRVYSIELYPIFGFTRFQTPWSRFDHCLVAWGGVMAQAVIAIPLVLWIALVGYTPFNAANAVMAILGFFSLGTALFNLLPVKPLDGSIAWELFPALLARRRSRRKPPSTPGSNWRRWG